MSNLIKAWSYSRYRDHARCPAFYKYKHIDKIPEPSSPAMARGSAIGKMAEDYTKGLLRRLPDELALFQKQFEAVRALYKKGAPVFVEESWCFGSAWEERAWNDWNNVWLRVKLDLAGLDEKTGVLVPVDHKTGKYRETDVGSYLEQLEIYAIGGLLKVPEAVGVSPRLWFLDAGVEYPQCNGEEIYYGREELPRLQKLWLKKTAPMFKETAFRPTPNSKCMYCPYSASKGGLCKY